MEKGVRGKKAFPLDIEMTKGLKRRLAVGPTKMRSWGLQPRPRTVNAGRMRTVADLDIDIHHFVTSHITLFPRAVPFAIWSVFGFDRDRDWITLNSFQTL